MNNAIPPIIAIPTTTAVPAISALTPDKRPSLALLLMDVESLPAGIEEVDAEQDDGTED